MKKLLVMCFVYCLWCSAPLFAGEPGFLEITKAEKKQKGVLAETYKAGKVIPGMSVEGGAAKVGDKIAVGQRVSVPRDIFVTFTSSNGNIVETKTQVVETKNQIIETKTQVVEKTVETKTQTVFIVGNIIPEGESYIQNEGWIRYSVIQKAIEFFNVYHNKYLAAVEGTVFEVNVDLQKKEIEFTAEQGDVSVTREFKVKAGDKEIEGLKDVVIISGRSGKAHSVKYDLSVEEAFKIFKNYEDVLTYFKEQLKKDEKEGDHLKILSAKNNIGLTLYYLARYDEVVKLFNSLLEKAVDLKWIATIQNNLGATWKEKGEYDKAIAYYEKALKIDLKVFGNDHPNLATRYNNLGSAWQAKGEYDKAISSKTTPCIKKNILIN
jgi:Tfp pilus assembly protein PilF